MARPGPKNLNLTGQRFGRLVAQRDLGMVDGLRSWACSCDCGSQDVVVRQVSLRSNGTRSCGCLRRVRRMQPANLDRRKEAQRLRSEGLTMAAIGIRLGISRQRVSVILQQLKDGTV
jgi:hypothetical protein